MGKRSPVRIISFTACNSLWQCKMLLSWYMLMLGIRPFESCRAFFFFKVSAPSLRMYYFVKTSKSLGEPMENLLTQFNILDAKCNLESVWSPGLCSELLLNYCSNMLNGSSHSICPHLKCLWLTWNKVQLMLTFLFLFLLSSRRLKGLGKPSLLCWIVPIPSTLSKAPGATEKKGMSFCGWRAVLRLLQKYILVLQYKEKVYRWSYLTNNINQAREKMSYDDTKVELTAFQCQCSLLLYSTWCTGTCNWHLLSVQGSR